MANEYKVKVGVEFNAIMNDVDSKLAQLKEDIKAVGNAGGNKQFLTGFQQDVDKLVAKLNKLRETEITPGNFNRFQAEISSITDDIAKAKGKMDEFASNSFGEKMAAQQSEIDKLNTAITGYTKTITDFQTRQQNGEQLNDDEIRQLQEAEAARTKAQRSLNGHLGALAKLEKQQGTYNNVTKGSEQIIEGAAKAVDELDKESKEYLTTQEQLANEKLANTIQTQVNRFIGFNAVLRYSRKYIQDLVKTYKEFDESLVAIAAVTGQTRDQMWQNIGVYNKMAQSLGTTTQEVINASKLYYQQGLTTTSVLKLTEETVKLATIAELDSADATEYLTTAMNGFKLSAEESTRVTDVWANLAAKTASDVDELAVAISKVASLAENAGMEIETASAFLNQMIETTREAPENLGTALKTIIARFQELKVSEEALSDGVDANKVERALKSAGVALRDVDGQFRDFDEVILDLSAKWNTLDRNTQRYIATIAAGSRQQSRFIALVSDYEGLVRNVNYAYDSLGSADAQMAVFQEGLTASTNRLKAAWEGLYTSWSESATVISKLIDGAADFVSTLADLGAGTSALLALGGLLIARILAGAAAREIEARGVKAVVNATRENTRALLENALATAVANGADATQVATLKELIKKTAAYTVAEEANTVALLKNAAASALVVLKYVAIAAVIALVVYGIIKLVNLENERAKKLQKEITANQQLAAQEKDRASNLGVLADELTRVHDAGEDESEVRQKIIDQFGDEIQGVNVLTDSYEKLIEALEKEQRLKNERAAGAYYNSWQQQKEAAEVDKETRAEQAAAKVNDKVTYGSDKDAESGQYTERYLGEDIHPYAYFDGKRYVYNPQTNAYDGLDEALTAAKQEAYNNALNDDSTFEPDKSQKNFVGKTLIESLGLDSTEYQDFISVLGEVIAQSEQEIFDSENKLTTEGRTLGENIINSLKGELTPEEIKAVSEIFGGSLQNLTTDLENKIANSGIDDKVKKIFLTLVNTYKDEIAQSLSGTGLNTAIQDRIKNNLSLDAQKAFIAAFKNLKNDPNAQQAYVDAVLGLINSGVPTDQLTAGLMTGLGDTEKGMEQYAALLSGFGKGAKESAVQLEALHNSLGLVNTDFVEGMDVIKDYNGVMDDFDDLMSGKLSDDDYSAKLESLIDTLDALGVAERNEIETMLYAASIRDDNGNRILKETGAIDTLIDSLYAEGETAVAAKRAEIEAYAAQLDATADHVIAIGKEMQAQEEAGHANSVATDALLENAYNEILALDDLETKALEAYDATEGGPGEAMKEQTTVIRRWAAQIKEGMSGAQVQALGESMKQSAKEARRMAAALSIAKRELGKAGKSAGSAAKETDKYKEALKELKEQLDEAKEAAEEYIDAILDYLAEEKEAAQEAIDAAEEALEKERDLLKIQLEAWKEYLEQRQKENQDALDLQGQAAAEYFKAEIEGIQAKIDALDKEAEAEDRILKLQKARDEYNRAQNSRTRLVLTKGAGWIFKADQKEISDARKTLNDVQREIQKAAYQDQIDELQKQADMWQEIADGITKSAEEIARLAAAVDKFRQGMAEGGTGYADVDAYGTAVTAQQGANDEYQRQLEEVEKWLEQVDWSYQDYMDDQARQQFLQEFMDGTVGEQDLQEKVTTYLEDMLKTEAYIEEQKKLIEKIEKVEAEYELEKAQLGLTKKQLKEARKIRKAIEKAFDPESGDLGLGKGSSYYQEVVAPLVETVQKIAEEIGKLEAGQGSGSSSGSGSGSSSGSGGTDSSGTADQGTTGLWDRDGTKDGENTQTTPPPATSCPPHNWILAYSDNYTKYWVCTKCGEVKTESIGTPQGPGITIDPSTPGFGGVGFGPGGGNITYPGFPIGGNGIGLPSISTLSTPTPSFGKVTNNSSAMTINIGTLESSANNFDGLVADITRNSMLRQPI